MRKALFAACFVVSMGIFAGRAYADTGIWINTDVLNRMEYQDGQLSMNAPISEVFEGIGADGCTVTEFEESMKKYPFQAASGFEITPFGISLYSEEDGAIEFTVDDLWFEIHENENAIWEGETAEDYYNGIYQSKLMLDGSSAWENIVTVYALAERTDGRYIFVSEDETALRTHLAESIAVINQVNQGLTAEVPKKSGWIQEEDHWRYYENNAYVTGAKHIDGYNYFFLPENGYMLQSSFYETGGYTFYFDQDGHSVTGWRQIDRNGVNCWHYFNGAGIMTTGWQQIDGYWYYLKPEDGTLVHSTAYTINGEEYIFDTNGHMLDGWQKVGDSHRFYNPTPNDFVFKQGENISNQYVTDKLNKKSAADTLAGYTMAVSFVNDISEWEKFNYSVKNWKDELGAILAGTIDPDNSIADHYMNQKEGCKAYLRSVLGELCGNEDLKLMSSAEKQAQSARQQAAEHMGYQGYADMLSAISKGTELWESVDRIFQDYSKNMALLDRISNCAPINSTLSRTVNDLMIEYQNQFFAELDRYATKESGKFIINNIDQLLGTEIGKLDAVIQLVYGNTQDLDAIDSVIYSSNLKMEAIQTLRNAEKMVKLSGGRDEEMADYISAFQVTNGIIKKQYEELLTYYQNKANPSKYADKIKKLEDGIKQLENQSFFSY